MSKLRDRGETIRSFILENVEAHPRDIGKLTAAKFGSTRQAVNKHLRSLVEGGSLSEAGKTKNKVYTLAPLEQRMSFYPLGKSELSESQVWATDIAPVLGAIPENVHAIWLYGFTEMFNNAIEHSEGTSIRVNIEKSATATTISISDDGVGIFRKIQAALGLADERHAVLELAKGRFTTDPKHHSGEGIFFASRMFDTFAILSGDVFFSHELNDKEDWIMERIKPGAGTTVWMTLKNQTSRSTKKIFDQFSTDDNYGFTRTVVPVKLAQYGDDNLVSRSQAKRLLSRIDRFKVVLFDFADVAMIGQAFADEIFRVFASKHPHIEISAINTTEDVRKMISRALVHDDE